jgi:hypothetical protein
MPLDEMQVYLHGKVKIILAGREGSSKPAAGDIHIGFVDGHPHVDIFL